MGRRDAKQKKGGDEQSIAGWNQTEPDVRLFDPNQTGLSIVKTAIGFGFSAHCNFFSLKPWAPFWFQTKKITVC